MELACAPGAEPQHLCGELAAALQKSGWIVTRPHLKEPVAVGGQVVHRTRVLVARDADDATQAAADTLADALEGALLRTGGPDDAPEGAAAPLTLVVGPQ
ncbi:MAG: LytR C-terminal domain-containing protein [Polyangiaceae bacterium]